MSSGPGYVNDPYFYKGNSQSQGQGNYNGPSMSQGGNSQSQGNYGQSQGNYGGPPMVGAMKGGDWDASKGPPQNWDVSNMSVDEIQARVKDLILDVERAPRMSKQQPLNNKSGFPPQGQGQWQKPGDEGHLEKSEAKLRNFLT